MKTLKTGPSAKSVLQRISYDLIDPPRADKSIPPGRRVQRKSGSFHDDASVVPRAIRKWGEIDPRWQNLVERLNEEIRRQTDLDALIQSNGHERTAETDRTIRDPEPRGFVSRLNLEAQPRADVEVGLSRYSVRAREAEREERERLWRRVTGWMPMYAFYQSRTERRIPVVVLERD